MKFWQMLLITVLMVAFVVPMQAQDKAKKAEFQYIGVKGCKMCHMSKKSGAAYKIWQKTKHAQAYATLASDEAKAIAKKKGIADPQKADECLSCHVAGHGEDAKRLGKKYAVEDGVSCEACHGPGSGYKSKKTMTAVYKGEIEPASVGLVKPTEETCKRCHNEKSPTFKSFNFKEMFEKIAHPIPK